MSLRGHNVTYMSRDEKPGEQVPEDQEEGHDNGSNLGARSESNEHHTIQCEVDEGH